MEEEVAVSSEVKVLYEKKHSELVRIIESFENLEKSKEWATLKELVFDGALASIERQILTEASNLDINTAKLYRLQGEKEWARKYADTTKYVETLKQQLDEINKKIK